MFRNEELTEDSKDRSAFIFRIKQSKQSALLILLDLEQDGIKTLPRRRSIFSEPDSGLTDEEILLLHNPKPPLDKSQI